MCRWREEEFVILLPTSSLENALLLANKISVYVQEMQIEYVGSMNDSIDRADKTLYHTKNSSRNCVKTDLDT